MKNRTIELVEQLIQKKVTIDDGLLSTGLLDSITAVDLILEIQMQLEVEIPISEASEILSTVRSLIDYVEAT